MHYIDTGDLSLPVKVVRSKGRMVRMRLDLGAGHLLISSPSGRWGELEQAFVREKMGWIRKQVARQAGFLKQREAFRARLRAGEILYLGEYRPLTLQTGGARRIRIDDTGLRLQGAGSANALDQGPLLQAGLKELAKHFLVPRTQEWARKTHLSLNAIRVKHQTSKWGSCSTRRNLNLNWHLVFLPPTLIDYLIVHELMHLHEMNHSPAFWNWVGKYYPAYPQARKTLQSYNWVIGILS